ncbi:hypothetical protein JCM8547_004719 [Rhodosporidiobolus lusitaniae]
MGLLSSFFLWAAPDSFFSNTIFPPPSTYDAERDMPDQTGKVAIVTGANTGVGFETAKYLVIKNARVYACSRSEEKGRAAVEKLNAAAREKQTQGGAIWLKLDLADLDSVKEAAEEFKAKEKRLDLLFNNAGVMIPPIDQLTKQGFDLQWGTNVVGHYLFSILLLASLRASFAATGVPPRVVHTSSSGNIFAPGPTGFMPDSTRGGPKRDELIKQWGKGSSTRWKLYGQSKLGNVWAADIVQDLLGEEGVSMSAHPGGLKTELSRSLPGWQVRASNLMANPAYMGAWTQLWGATSPEGANFQKKFLYPWARLGKSGPRGQNEETIKQVKEHLDEAVAAWL